jgi:hypothetical protein
VKKSALRSTGCTEQVTLFFAGRDGRPGETFMLSITL